MSAIEPGRDRDARLVLLVRPAVGVERDDRRDPTRRRPLEGVDHDQQLHDRLIDRVGRRLDDEDVLLADVVQDLDEDVLVRELEHLGLARLRCRDSARSCAPVPGSRCRGRSRTGPRTRVPPLVRRSPRSSSPTAGGSVPPGPPAPGVVIVAHGVPLRKSGPERGDGRRPDRPRRGASRSRRAHPTSSG